MNQLINQQTIASLSGASGSVFIICTVIYYVFNYNPKFLGLLLSFITSAVIGLISKIDFADFANNWILLVNACLIYATAVGLNTVTSKPGGPPPRSGGGYGGGGSGGGVLTKTIYKTRKQDLLKRWF